MTRPQGADSTWEEIIAAVEGSRRWCRCVIHTLHLCKSVLLRDEEEPLRFGVGTESLYTVGGTVDGGLSLLPATVLLKRSLLREAENPAPTFPKKIAVLAGTLAHEIAHHLVPNSMAVGEAYEEIVALGLAARRRILTLLDASAIAKASGIDRRVVAEHWGIADETIAERTLNRRAAISDHRVASGAFDDWDDKDFREIHEQREEDEAEDEAEGRPRDEAAFSMAGEWIAAVIGCVMFYRVLRGVDYALRLVESVVVDVLPAGGSLLAFDTLMAACEAENAERDAAKLALETIAAEFRHATVQDSCGEFGMSDWERLFRADAGEVPGDDAPTPI